jgi:hypothetical protein
MNCESKVLRGTTSSNFLLERIMRVGGGAETFHFCSGIERELSLRTTEEGENAGSGVRSSSF